MDGAKNWKGQTKDKLTQVCVECYRNFYEIPQISV